MNDLIEETRSGRVIFHERYWKDVSKDAKDFIKLLLQPHPDRRLTSQQALRHVWLTGTTASDHNIVADLKSRMVKNRLRLGIERVKLAQRIEKLRKEEGTHEEDDDIPEDAERAADQALSPGTESSAKSRFSRAMKADIFRAVVLAKTREMREQKATEEMQSGTGSSS